MLGQHKTQYWAAGPGRALDGAVWTWYHGQGSALAMPRLPRRRHPGMRSWPPLAAESSSLDSAARTRLRSNALSILSAGDGGRRARRTEIRVRGTPAADHTCCRPGTHPGSQGGEVAAAAGAGVVASKKARAAPDKTLCTGRGVRLPAHGRAQHRVRVQLRSIDVNPHWVARWHRGVTAGEL